MRRFCKSMIIFTHTKISAVTLAGIMLIWSLLAFGPEDSLFFRTLNDTGIAYHWGAAMFMNGLLLLMGCVFPFRKLRHIGLVLCCFQMMALGGYFFERAIFTPVSASMPWLALMSLITLMAEVKGKPRHGCA